MSYLGDNATGAGPEGEQWLRGQVHDPTSFRMGGVAGHAGLFRRLTIWLSTAA
jgi:hypothetical protein